jgi:glutathione S-transferase
MPITVHRFEETIGGQRYVVEVRPALGDHWRACLVRTAGVPTALMPFYGATPRAALDALVRWLSHAHGVAADSL